MLLVNKLRSAAWRVLGRPPQRAARRPWDVRVDTGAERRTLIDLAMVHLQIATRNETADGCAQPLRGAYAEFGVFRGDTFVHACKRGEALLPWMRFLAFDSFQGLPPAVGIDAGAEFVEGQFACDRASFDNRVRNAGVDMDRVSVFEGWFNDTLVAGNKSTESIGTVSLAYIDCDFYSSTIPVLEYLTDRLTQGSIVCFDDWYCFRADPRFGVQLAVNEWLAANPNLSLTPWRSFSHHGQAFFVCRSDIDWRGDQQND